jgi:hypothetical protein
MSERLTYVGIAFVSVGILVILGVPLLWRTSADVMSAKPSEVLVLAASPGKTYSVELMPRESVRVVNLLSTCGCIAEIQLDKWELARNEVGTLEFKLRSLDTSQKNRDSGRGTIIVLYVSKVGNGLLNKLEIPVL